MCRLVSGLVLRKAARRRKEPHYRVLGRGRGGQVEKIQLFQAKKEVIFRDLLSITVKLKVFTILLSGCEEILQLS